MSWVIGRRTLPVLILSAIAVVTLASGVARAIPTDLTGSVSPMPSQTNGEHPLHNLILSDHGKVQSVLVGMYFTSGGAQQFRINVSQWCDMRPGGNYAIGKRFLALDFGGTTRFISGQQACNGWLDSQTFTIPGNQIQQNFRDSGMFGARVVLRWVNTGEESNCNGGANSCKPIRNYLSSIASGEGSRIRFRFNPLGNGSRVGLIESGNASTAETNNSIVQASGGYSNLYMPFGLSCSVTTTQANGAVSVYDADNGTSTQANPLYFYVGTLGPNGAVTPLSANDYRGEGGGAASGVNDIRIAENPNGNRSGVSQALRDNSRGYPVFTPSNFNNVGGVTTVEIFRVQPATKYVLMIMSQHAGQFTYIGVPGDAIFGSPDFDCPVDVPDPTGTIRPNATLDGTEYEVGASATGSSLYSSTFTLPANGGGQQWRGPYLTYTSRMWYDNGSATYAAPDVQRQLANPTGQAISSSPVTNAALTTWAENPLVLNPVNDPNFKICISMQISDAYYETRPTNPSNSPWTKGSINFIATPVTRCADIKRYPDIRALDGDVRIGGVFKNGLSACTRNVTDTNQHALVGHLHAVSATQRGSMSQYGALALGRVANFGSTGFLPSVTGSTDLTFARAGTTLGNFYGGTTGTVTTNCFNETFGAYPAGTATTSTTLAATDNANSSYAFPGNNGTLTINGGTLTQGTRRIIRVTQPAGSTGNKVVMDDNITYAAAGTMTQIPQFILLVDGDIDIKVRDTVTVLAGLYVTRGNFATCNEYTSSTPNIHLDSNSPCRNPLRVNGAVITGKSVQPYRTNAVSQNYTLPAEEIRLRGDLLIADYAYKQQTGNFMTVGQLELPPRF